MRKAGEEAKEEAKEDAEEDAEEESEQESDDAEDKKSDSDSVKEEPSKDEASDSDSETAVEAKPANGMGSKDAPIELDCQYTTIPYHDHTAVPRFTVASVPPSFAPQGSLPRPQHYVHQFLANHDRLENAGSEEDSLFVTQPSAPWMDAVAHRAYGYHQRPAPGHEASSSAQFFW